MLQIRPLVREDREHLLRLLKERGTFIDIEIQTAMEVIDEALTRPEREEYIVFCACLNNSDPIGFICFGPIPMTEGCYDLYWIAVDRKYSGRGVGSELLVGMEEYLGKKNVRRIYADTSSTAPYEAARCFYEKFGFEVDSVLDDFYRPGDDKIIYRKEV